MSSYTGRKPIPRRQNAPAINISVLFPMPFFARETTARLRGWAHLGMPTEVVVTILLRAAVIAYLLGSIPSRRWSLQTPVMGAGFLLPIYSPSLPSLPNDERRDHPLISLVPRRWW